MSENRPYEWKFSCEPSQNGRGLGSSCHHLATLLLDFLLLWLGGFSIQVLCSIHVNIVLLLLGKGLGLRWRLSFEIKHLLLTKHLTLLSAQQKPYTLHAIAWKRERPSKIYKKTSTKLSVIMFSPKGLLKSFFPVMLFETPLFKEDMYFSQTYNEWDEVWCARCEVHGARCMVRSSRCEIRGTWYVIRGAGYTCWVCWENTCKDGNNVHNMGACWVRTPLP